MRPFAPTFGGMSQVAGSIGGQKPRVADAPSAINTHQAPEKAHRNLCASWRAPTFTPTKVGVWPANGPCRRSNLRMSLVRQQIAAGLNAKGHKVSHVAVGRLLKDRAHPA